MSFIVFLWLLTAKHKLTASPHRTSQNQNPPSSLLHLLPAAVASAGTKNRLVSVLALTFSSVCVHDPFFFLFLSASLPIAETLITPSRCSRFHSNDKAFFLRLCFSASQHSVFFFLNDVFKVKSKSSLSVSKSVKVLH